MKINLLDVDLFVKQTKTPEVTNPVFFNQSKEPTPDGLFSTEIFGELGSNDRFKKFGYIDLNGHYLHPVAYKAISRVDRKMLDIISGEKYYKFNKAKGEFIPDEENGRTGIDFMYEVWNDIKWKTTDSSARDNRLKLLRLDRDKVFVTKWLVVPAGNRDFDSTSHQGGNQTIKSNPINTVYSQIIRSVDSTRNGSLSFINNATKFNIQKKLVSLYDYFMDDIDGKKGTIHRGLMGKTVDYSSRSVITTPKIQNNSWKDLDIKFGYVGVPIAHLAVDGFPFYVKFIQDFMRSHQSEIFNIKGKDGKPIGPINIDEQYDEKAIRKLINNYVHDVDNRFRTLYIKDNKGNEYPLPFFQKNLKRNFTATDLLFIASYEIYQNKHVMITRYPVENIKNVMPMRVKILSTQDTIPEMEFEDIRFHNYPVVYPDYPTPISAQVFIDTLQLNGSMIGSLGADFDGDTVSIRTIYSVEANKEAEQLIWAKSNILDQKGNSMRTVSNEAVQALATLTKDPV